MNPTVSVIRASCVSLRRIRRVAGSRVANNRFSVYTSLWVRAFSKVDFPALV